jgi:hypothetical protein
MYAASNREVVTAWPRSGDGATRETVPFTAIGEIYGIEFQESIVVQPFIERSAVRNYREVPLLIHGTIKNPPLGGIQEFTTPKPVELHVHSD